MPAPEVLGRLLDRFAELLEYPRAGSGGEADPAGPERLASAAEACAALARERCPEAAERLASFAGFARAQRTGRLQELYTRTFDLEAACHPYVGHYLFGESYKRSAFMVGLKGRFAETGFRPDPRELPDHLAVLLRFVAARPDGPEATELLEEAIVPAVRRMARSLAEGGKGAGDGYPAVLGALVLALTEYFGSGDEVRAEVVGESGPEAATGPGGFPPGCGSCALLATTGDREGGPDA